jgi:phasin
MAENSTTSFNIPPEMRAFTEKSVEQARQAFDGFITAAQRTMTAFQGQAEATQKGAKDLGEKALGFAERNMASSFDFAQQLMTAKTVQDMLKMQAEYIKTQMQTLTEQAKDLGAHTTKVAQDATRPKG